MDTVAAWAEGLEGRGYQLAPASFLMQIRNPVEASSPAPSEAHSAATDHADPHGDTH